MKVTNSNATDINAPNDKLTGTNEPAINAQYALLARHRFSLRLQIYLGFFLIFLLALGIAGVMLYTMYQLENKMQLLQVVNDYVSETDQARRQEKNYFLYGTSLNEALESVYQTKHIFESQDVEFKRILGNRTHDTIVQNMAQYQGLLEKLHELELKKMTMPSTRKKRMALKRNCGNMAIRCWRIPRTLKPC